MLGRLVGWLRILGFDTTYAQDVPDSTVARRARHERRILLTNDLELSRAKAMHTVYVRSRDPLAQLTEVLDALQIGVRESLMFTRGTLCNGVVVAAEKEVVRHRVPPAAYALYDEFTECKPCDKLYWKGGHHERILEATRDFAH